MYSSRDWFHFWLVNRWVQSLSIRVHFSRHSEEVNYFWLYRNWTFLILKLLLCTSIVEHLNSFQELPPAEGKEHKKVRFAQNYTTSQIADVWKKFLNIVISQMTDAFELERAKQKSAQTTKALAPHQHVEISERKKKKVAVSDNWWDDIIHVYIFYFRRNKVKSRIQLHQMNRKSRSKCSRIHFNLMCLISFIEKHYDKKLGKWFIELWKNIE